MLGAVWQVASVVTTLLGDGLGGLRRAWWHLILWPGQAAWFLATCVSTWVGHQCHALGDYLAPPPRPTRAPDTLSELLDVLNWELAHMTTEMQHALRPRGRHKNDALVQTLRPLVVKADLLGVLGKYDNDYAYETEIHAIVARLRPHASRQEIHTIVREVFETSFWKGCVHEDALVTLSNDMCQVRDAM